MTRWTCSALVSVLVLVVPGTPTEARQEPGTYAAARFTIDHPNGCTRTTAFVEVFYHPAARPGDPAEEQSRVQLTYTVFGQPLNGGCDGLFYYDIEGTALLGPGDFSVLPNQKQATLDTTLEVFDRESNTFFDVAVSVEWFASAGGRSRTADAVLSVSSPQINPLYIVDPLTPSASAVIARLPPE